VQVRHGVTGVRHGLSPPPARLAMQIPRGYGDAADAHHGSRNNHIERGESCGTGSNARGCPRHVECAPQHLPLVALERQFELAEFASQLLVVGTLKLLDDGILTSHLSEVRDTGGQLVDGLLKGGALIPIAQPEVDDLGDRDFCGACRDHVADRYGCHQHRKGYEPVLQSLWEPRIANRAGCERDVHSRGSPSLHAHAGHLLQACTDLDREVLGENAHP
jgi:hypothetical protein